ESKFYKPTLVALMLLLLFGVSRAQRELNRSRDTLGLTKITPLENAPPVLAFTTVALGGFRGLIANVLWIRADELQQEDKHFEMVQLADWITKLEPHFVQVWTVQAWNMAYNISVKFPAPEDRWRWVRRGIELLRDDGIRFNPDETLLYRELSWFFQHKIGQNLDDAHKYYKSEWFREMDTLFGGKPNFEELLNPKTDQQKQRVKVLRETYKMDPQIMREVDQNYGPLEWRLPDAHAIYWADVGRRRGKPEDQNTLYRSIYQTMQMSFERGALDENKFGPPALRPNLDAVTNVNKAYEELLKSNDPTLKDQPRTGHKNFLKKVPYYLYLYNRQREAQYWFDYLKSKYPEAVPATLSLDDYAVQNVTEITSETDANKTAAAINGLLVQACLALIQDEDDRAVNYERLATKVYTTFSAKVAGAEIRVGLPPLADMKASVIKNLLDPKMGLGPEAAARLRTKLNLPGEAEAKPPATPATKP
ncbi:MAG: hypothetical protein JWM68_5249, partial [Verrucomicrobiales bacterium]|nr:hypothetical protein [Verrucomicrobiales bacterium]